VIEVESTVAVWGELDPCTTGTEKSLADELPVVFNRNDPAAAEIPGEFGHRQSSGWDCRRTLAR